MSGWSQYKYVCNSNDDDNVFRVTEISLHAMIVFSLVKLQWGASNWWWNLIMMPLYGPQRIFDNVYLLYTWCLSSKKKKNIELLQRKQKKKKDPTHLMCTQVHTLTVALHGHRAVIDGVCHSVRGTCYIIHIYGGHGKNYLSFACLQRRWTPASASSLPVAASEPG